MSSIKELSKSLIDAVTEVVTDSIKVKSNVEKTLAAEGLRKFGVSEVSKLSEDDRKRYYSWLQLKLQEASCGCGEDVTEDDMPGDAPFHKDGEEDAEKKKDLGEEESDDELSEAVSSSTKSKIAGHLSKLTSTPRGKDRANVANAILNLMGKDSSVKGTKFEKAFGKVLPLATKYGANPEELEKAVDRALEALNESIALEADEIATNGAVGVTDADEQLPVHVDVIRDSNPLSGTTEYRLFAQFNTNTLPQIVPPVVLPGAPTLDALRDVVEGLPWYCDECARALADAADVPHERPEHAGVVAEALTLSQTDRLVVASIKRILKTTDVTVIYNNTEYLARIGSKEQGEFYHLGIVLEPSSKRLGKLNWAVYDQTISDQDPNSNQRLAAPLFSLPFDQGDIALSVRKLQEVLQIAAKGVASGSYASQEPSF